MKPKIFTTTLLFFSAYSPLFLILAVKDFDFSKTIYFRHPIAIYCLLGISVVSVLLLFLIVSAIKTGNMSVEIKSVKNRSADLINYTIPYIVSFFGFDLSKIDDVVSLSIFLLLMLILTMKSKSVFMNPILLIAGYNLYDMDYEFDKKITSTIVISKYEMRSGESYHIRSLTRFLYFVTARDTSNDDE